MAIEERTETTFRAICDKCGAAGPEQGSVDEAIESVTARRAASRTGFSILGRWLPVEGDGIGKNGLYCGACKGSASP